MSTDKDGMTVKERIRRGRAKFAAMGGTYFVGVFNDNFFKQAAMLLAVAAGKEEIQSWAAAIYTLPFVVLAAQAGWLADRFPKRTVVIGAKVLELTAMIFGAMGVIYGRWDLMLVMLGIEGIQAAIFSPALNGSIPELYPAEYVVTANAIIRMISTGAILAGIAAAGFVLDIKGYAGQIPMRLAAVAGTVLAVSAAGVAMSFGVARFAAASSGAKFPWRGPVETVKVLYEIRKDKLLSIAIWGNAFFWLIGSLEVLVLNQMGVGQFKFSNTMTSGLAVAEMLGIAAGGVLSIYFTKRMKWYRLMVPAGVIMAISMLATAAGPYVGETVRLVYLFIALAVMGIAGGVYMIPLEAFIQVRPAADRKGATIAAANFAAFGGMLLSGLIFYLFTAMGIKASNDFAIMGASAMMVMIIIFILLREVKE